MDSSFLDQILFQSAHHLSTHFIPLTLLAIIILLVPRNLCIPYILWKTQHVCYIFHMHFACTQKFPLMCCLLSVLLRQGFLILVTVFLIPLHLGENLLSVLINLAHCN